MTDQREPKLPTRDEIVEAMHPTIEIMHVTEGEVRPHADWIISLCKYWRHEGARALVDHLGDPDIVEFGWTDAQVSAALREVMGDE